MGGKEGRSVVSNGIGFFGEGEGEGPYLKVG
jgi:hypothetical protein